MSRAVARLVLLAAVLAEADPAAAQNGVASTSVETLCRAAPEPSAEAVRMLEEGDLILRYEGVSTSTGQWMRVTASLFGRDGGPDHCWVPSSDLVLSRGAGHFLQLADGLLAADLSPTLDELLAVHNLFEHPWYREQVEVTIADRFLASGEGWSSDNRLRLYIILSGWNRGHRGEVEGSPALGLARLRVLRMALHEFMPHVAGVRTHAWIASLGDEVALTDEGHSWTVSDEAYLSLYEQHQADPFAEEILWTYAIESDGYSCEGEFACSVREVVIERLARYWTDFPRGRHIAEAVEEARALVGSGLELCNAARGTGKDTPEAGMWSWSGWDRSGVELTRELLATLAEVKGEDKAPLLERLAELEACAA